MDVRVGLEILVERAIEIEGIDPRELYGVENRNLSQIAELFPKLKLVARGSSLKVLGDEAEIDRFEKKLHALTEYYLKYNRLSPDVIEQTMEGGLPDHGAEEAIVYGNNGTVVRARTVNQQALVRLSETNDLLFAVGPAGSGKTYTAIALAVRALKNKEVKRIILTRPAVEAGEKLGFLPGKTRSLSAAAL